jgi:Tol biopolymer transport system component
MRYAGSARLQPTGRLASVTGNGRASLRTNAERCFMVKVVPVLLISLALLSACSGSDDSATSGLRTEGSTPRPPPAAPTGETTESSAQVAPFDPDDAAWVIQQDATIVVVGADGVGSFSPTAETSGSDENNPDWSPDGGQISYLFNDGRADLWVVGVAGDGARKLYDCESPCDYLDDPAWSPDGASIAACKMTDSGDGHLGSLIGVDVASGDETTLATFAPEDFCGSPRWSPGGSEISFELGHRPGTSLFDEPIEVTLSVVDLSADPPAIRPLTDPALFASWGDWNPSGDLIVYSALPTPDAESPELFTVRPDGSEVRQLTDLAVEGGSATEPTFDLDGATVVFVDGSTGALRRVDLITGAITNPFTTDTFGTHPSPRPRP